MPVKMGVDPNKIVQPQPVPPGWYKLKLVGFKPETNKKKDGVNYKGIFEIMNPPPPPPDGSEFTKTIIDTMSNKMPRSINDISHGLGFPLEPDGELVGQWHPDAAAPEDVSKYQYRGPLLGRTMEAELAVTQYGNKIRQVRCAVTDCATKFPKIKHQLDMIGKQ